MTATMHTSPAGEAAARMMFRGDWDADGTVQIGLPVKVAADLLVARGWTTQYDAAGETIESWVSPSGVRYWMTDEALATALAAEVQS